MADIKTRDIVKGTIKTLDKSAIAADRMRSAYAKTKERAEEAQYAEGKYTDGVDEVLLKLTSAKRKKIKSA